MGRYANRFQAGGSVGVGATYTAAAGGGNSKFAVEANGQILSRVEYPALANYYGDQTDFDTATFNRSPNTNNQPLIYDNGGAISRQGEITAELSGFVLYLQSVLITTQPSITGTAIWYTQNGENWKLSFPFESPIRNTSFVTTSGFVYLLHEEGLYRTNDGLTFENVYNSGTVRGLTEQNGVVIFSTGDSNVFKTTDFTTITTENVSGFNVNALVSSSGVLYAFSNNTTGVRFSTDTGLSWNSPTSGLVSTGNYSAKVISRSGIDYILVGTSSTSGAFFQYSTNPTGTTSVWVNIGTNKLSNDASNFISHLYYDSTDDVLICTPRFRLATNSVYARRFSGITGTAFNFTGTVANITAETGTFTDQTVTPFVVKTNSIKAIYIGNIGAYQPTGSTWQGTGNLVLDSGAGGSGVSGFRPSPFFSSIQFVYAGYHSIGTTNSGTRYIFNASSDNALSGGARYAAVYVEESGYFKVLKSHSTGFFSNGSYTVTTSETGLSVGSGGIVANNCFIVNECSGKYIVAWVNGISRTSLPSGLFYNIYSQDTKIGSPKFTNVPATGFPTSPNWIVGGTKNNGVYFVNTSDSPSASLPTRINAKGERSVFSIGAPAINSWTGGRVGLAFSDVDDDVIITTRTTGQVTGSVVVINGDSLVTNTNVILKDPTGGIVNPASGFTVFKSQNNYHTIDVSGNVYIGTDFADMKFYTQTVGLPTGVFTNTTGSTPTFREISKNTILGPVFIQNNAGLIQSRFAGPLVTANRSTGNMSYSQYFKYTEDSYLFDGTVAINSAIFTVSTGSFIVPKISSPATGETKYIIAR